MRAKRPAARRLLGHLGGGMTLGPADLKKISALTLEHYDQRAEEFWRRHARLTTSARTSRRCCSTSRAQPPFTILDLGCGPGRDLKAFAGARPRRRRSRRRGALRRHGAQPQRLRGVAAGLPRARSAARALRRRVRQRLAVPRPEPGAAARAARAARHAEAGRRRCSARTRTARTRRAGTAGATAPTTISRPGAGTVSAAGFAELAHYYRPPGLPRAQQPWLATRLAPSRLTAASEAALLVLRWKRVARRRVRLSYPRPAPGWRNW